MSCMESILKNYILAKQGSHTAAITSTQQFEPCGNLHNVTADSFLLLFNSVLLVPVNQTQSKDRGRKTHFGVFLGLPS